MTLSRSFPVRPGLGSASRLSLAALAILGLTGCLAEEDGGNSSPVATYDNEVLDIDREAGTITTRDAYQYCDGETLATDSNSVEEQYLITDGKLFRWEPGYSCNATIATGSSSDIVGTWMGDPPEYHDAPADDSAYCDSEMYEVREVFTEINRRVKLTETISEKKIRATITGEACWAEMFGWLLIANSGGEAAIDRSEKQCDAVTLTRSDADDIDLEGEAFAGTAKVTSEETAAGTRIVFTSGEVRCEETMPAGAEDAASCADGGGAQARLEACAYATGFFGEDVFFKQGVSSVAENRRTWRRVLRGI